MSGYFASLAAQVRAPQTPGAPARGGMTPTPLEQHVEVEASLTTQARVNHRDGPNEPAPPVAQAHEPPRSDSSAPFKAPFSAPAQTALALRTPFTPDLHETSAVGTPPLDPMTTQAQPATRAPMVTDLPHAPAIAPRPARASADRVDTNHFNETMAPTLNVLAEAHPIAAQGGLPAHQQGTPSVPSAVLNLPPSAFIQPDARRQHAEQAPAIAPRTTMPAPSALQSTVRIGTITLEVHPPAVAAPTAPPPAAATPTPAPAQFSLRRHHVRWS